MSEETENTEMSHEEFYKTVLNEIKKEYKPRLKKMSKNELINISVELCTQVALYKEQLKQLGAEND